LRIGDDVRVGGVKVGTVREMNIIMNKDTKEASVEIKFRVPERLQIRQGARLGVQSTLTGASVLNFDQLGSGALLPPTEIIIGSPNPLTRAWNAIGEAGPEIASSVHDLRTITIPKINAAVDKTSETVTTFRETGQQSAQMMTQLHAKLDAIVDRWYRLADKGVEALEAVRALFGDTKADFRTTVANLASSTTTLREKLPPIMTRMDEVTTKVSKSMDTALAALDDIKKTTANARDLSASTRDLVVGNRSKIDGMIASLKKAGDNLKFATAEIRRSPWRLLYKPQPGEVANLNIYDSARQFAEGAGELNDAAGALRDALQKPDVKKDEIQKLLDRLDKSFSGFQEVENQLWDRVKE
jgi:ABC-type transporter Mla subunit MlaD